MLAEVFEESGNNFVTTSATAVVDVAVAFAFVDDSNHLDNS